MHRLTDSERAILSKGNYRWRQCVILLFLFINVLLLIPSPISASFSQPQPQVLENKPVVNSNIDGFPVVLDGKTIGTIWRGIPGFSAEERAYTISRRLKRIAQDSSIAIEDLTIRKNSDDNSFYLGVGQDVLLTVTERDAKARRTTAQALAEQSLRNIKEAMLQYRQDRKPEQLFRHTIYAITTSIIFLAIGFAVIKFTGSLFPSIARLVASRLHGIRVKNIEIIPASAISEFLLQLLKLLRLAVFIILFFYYAAFILRLYPWTRAVGKSVMYHFYQSAELVLTAIGNYLPNLFIVAILIFITYYTLRVLKPFFIAIQRGTLVIPGFYVDWAQPTYNLLSFLIIALGVVLAFPYVPGFNSPAFQGVSVFLGLLLSLGSTSAITNVIGGVILTYTRSFRIGDHIRVDNVIGDIIEKNFLAIRICTPANQIITIPNSALLSNNVVNYNISTRDLSRSLILQTTITLGYDISWRQIHATLIEAALATEHILADPPPFVIQTSLDNNYASYQLNAYTDAPNRMVLTYSDLHQHIQDKCNENGIEILSPSYTALRDGNASTMPATYLPPDYVAPPFHVNSSQSKTCG